ncbi:MAG: cytochrome C oxidase subunit II [Gemmatimonas sp. SG8_28]|nr:MAG: cytochrome C oxidase subunit II [Gemmatimonas sp. SG8_28]
MKVHQYEKAFLWVGAVMLVLFLGALSFASLAMGIQLPGRVSQVDPAQVRTQPPFNEPGLRQVGENEYEAVILGQIWHGLHIERTRINLMLIPGQISKVTYTFDEPGEYLVICHEYCGSGHHLMYGKVIVE